MLHLGNQKKRVALPSLTPTTKANCYGIINGSLLRNNETNLEDFVVPTEWMIDCICDEQAAGTDWSNLLVENYLAAELLNVQWCGGA